MAGIYGTVIGVTTAKASIDRTIKEKHFSRDYATNYAVLDGFLTGIVSGAMMPVHLPATLYYFHKEQQLKNILQQ